MFSQSTVHPGNTYRLEFNSNEERPTEVAHHDAQPLGFAERVQLVREKHA